MDHESEPRFKVEHQPGIDLRIYDPAFQSAYSIEAQGQGDEVDAVFYDILLSPAGLRSLGINQLSKSELEETYEGSADFKRWQHVAGVYKTIRHFSRQLNYSNDTILQYALVACLPDLGHGVKSHATDIMIEGAGGEENFHDLRVAQVIDLGEIGGILDKHKVKSPFDDNGKVAIDVPPWIECPAPGLNVDRLHYINAELALLFPGNEDIASAISLDNLAVNENSEFVFKDINSARIWAKGALLCSSEHWNDPINRLILHTSVEALKRTIFMRYLHNVESFDNGYAGAPQDYTFLIDKDFDTALANEASSRRPDLFMNAVYSVLQSLGHHERLRFATHKQRTYQEFVLDSDAREYPNTLINPHRAAFGIPPPVVEVMDSAQQEKLVKDLHIELKGRGALYMTDGQPVGILKRLKKRQFNPLVKTKYGSMTLSELDPNFTKSLEENGRALDYVGAVLLHLNPQTRDAIADAIHENSEAMERSAQLPDLSADQIRSIIKGAGNRALSSAIAEGRWQEL